jgi:hypothetical protein
MKQIGYIAFYNKKRIEIPFEIGSLYQAKLEAIRLLKVPKSKQGLLAIAPGYEAEVINNEPNTQS